MLKQVVITLFATIVQACTDSDCDKSFAEICAENGFKFESHTVTTEDGYILTMMRIPGMLGEQVTSVKPPVFFQHGLFDSSDAFISNWADKAPAFVAVRAGYDVWLGNTRGNKYSRKHVKLNPDINRQQFWDFDLEQMGQYDLPAELDFVATYTGIQKIAYIGHSQGTAQMYYGLAELQDYYAQRISVFVALGSVTLLEHASAGYLTYTADNYEKVDNYLALYNVHEIMADKNWWWNIEYHIWCDDNQDDCFLKGEESVTSNPNLDDEDRFMVYGAHNPSGASVRSLLFFAQNIKMNRFQKWAPKFNQLNPLMNERTTELIPLQNITKVPVAIFVGGDDIVANPTDGYWTAEQIGGAVIKYQIIDGGHLSFVVGKDMTWFTEDVMDIIRTYQPIS